MTDLRDLLIHELGDLLYAERRFQTATRAMVRETLDPEIKARLEQHLSESVTQISRVEEAFESIGEKPKAEKCPGAIGLREEHDSFKREEKPSKSVLAAFDLGSGLRVEHYEIAAYESAIVLATALGEQECAQILQENLDEELEMARFLKGRALEVLSEMTMSLQQ